MCAMSYRTSLALLLIVVSTTAPAMATDAEELRARFLAEAPKGWRLLSDCLLHARGRIELTVSDITPSSVPSHYRGYEERVSFLLNGDTYRCVEADDTGRVSVGCRNPGQTFHLKAINRIAEPKPSRLYRIDSITPVGPSAEWTPHSEAADHVWRISPLLYTPFAIGDWPLADLIRSPTCQLLSVGAVGDHGEFVEICFNVMAPQEAERWDVVAILDPSNSWAVQSYRKLFKTAAGRAVWDCAVAYDPGLYMDSGICLPRTAVVLVEEQARFDAGFRNRRELRLVEFSSETIPESEFSLSAFGLSEPEQRSTSATASPRLAIILFNVGAFLVVVGVWLFSRRRRTSG